MLTEQQRKEFLLKKIDQLPSFPGVVSELARLIDNPLTALEAIEKILSTDTGLTIKTLRIANSAYYSIPGGAKTLRRAITYLGMGSLKQMVLTSAVFDQFKTPTTQFDVAAFWKHSVCTAAVAELLARKLSLGTPSDVFICGLVHDMGKVLINMYDPELSRDILAISQAESIPYEDAEKKLFAPGHGYVGAMIAKKWNLAPTIQAAVLDHHNVNIVARFKSNPDVNKAVAAVYLANRLVGNASVPKDAQKPYSFENDEILKCLDVPSEALEKLAPDIEKTMASALSLYESLSKT